MRRMAKADVFAENKLFATVDSTVRKVVHDQIPFLLTDTVGFIRKLPTTLVECFKSTLDEIREADILLHVVDVSHPACEEQIEIVNRTLAEIGAADKPTVLVFNKIDLYHNEEATHPEESTHEGIGEGEEEVFHSGLDRLKTTYWNQQNVPAVFVSAEQREHLDDLWRALMHEVSKVYYTIFPNYLPQSTYAG